MYLTDQQIATRLAEFDFTPDDLSEPFDPDLQVGPCSVDLRLSRIIWKPNDRRLWRPGRPPVIDLTRSQLMELNPVRGWRRVEAAPHDVITIKPGELILARTAERFHVPSDCAAAIEGRSSFARLGLSVHAAGGFINPGYTGRMPLTLYNQSPFTLRVPVGTPLCQIMFIALGDPPKADYATRDDRKYRDDYGGPSYWWRDEMMRRIHERAKGAQLAPRVFEELDALFAVDEPDYGVYERLEKFLASSGTLSYGSADELLSAFSQGERRRELGSRTAVYGARAAFLAALGICAPYWFFTTGRDPWLLVASLVMTALALVATVWGWWNTVPDYMTPERLDKIRRATRRQPSVPASSPSGQPPD